MNSTIRIAIGPRLPEFGSWNWLGEGLTDNLQLPFVVEQFAEIENPPDSDIVVFIKFLPTAMQLAQIAQRTKIVYLPVDMHGDCREIDSGYDAFRYFSKVLVNSERLIRYFASYCEVEYVDHPLKFALAEPRISNQEGPLVWIGQLCNLPPVVDWVNSQNLDQELWVLSNFAASTVSPKSLGFTNDAIRIEVWDERRHIDFLRVASAAIDVKGNDFRARHKPPAKALDFLASGIPVILNRGSSADLHLSQLGAVTLNTDDWKSQLTPEHRQLVFKQADSLRQMVSPQRVWQKVQNVLLELKNSA